MEGVLKEVSDASRFQTILSATQWTYHVWSGSEVEWGHTEGSPSGDGPGSRGVRAWESAWAFARCTLVEGDVGGRGAESLLFDTSPPTGAHVFMFRTKMSSVDSNWRLPGTFQWRISPFPTWSCFSLNYNCFLHNEQPAREWQSIKNYFSGPLRLQQNRMWLGEKISWFLCE